MIRITVCRIIILRMPYQFGETDSVATTRQTICSWRTTYLLLRINPLIKLKEKTRYKGE